MKTGGRRAVTVRRVILSLLVVGEAPGAAKLSKAEELGIPILDEPAFRRLLETGDA